MKRKTEIIIEIDRTMILRRESYSTAESWCDRCGAFVVTLSARHAAELLDVDTTCIFKMVEDGRAHVLLSADGILLVCEASLPDDYSQVNANESKNERVM